MSDKVNWSDMYPNIEEPSWVKDVELLTAQEALALHKLGLAVEAVNCLDGDGMEFQYCQWLSEGNLRQLIGLLPHMLLVFYIVK